MVWYVVAPLIVAVSAATAGTDGMTTANALTTANATEVASAARAARGANLDKVSVLPLR
jgi:hypothetical protein